MVKRVSATEVEGISYWVTSATYRRPVYPIYFVLRVKQGTQGERLLEAF